MHSQLVLSDLNVVLLHSHQLIIKSTPTYCITTVIMTVHAAFTCLISVIPGVVADRHCYLFRIPCKLKRNVLFRLFKYSLPCSLNDVLKIA